MFRCILTTQANVLKGIAVVERLEHEGPDEVSEAAWREAMRGVIEAELANVAATRAVVESMEEEGFRISVMDHGKRGVLEKLEQKAAAMTIEGTRALKLWLGLGSERTPGRMDMRNHIRSIPYRGRPERIQHDTKPKEKKTERGRSSSGSFMK